MENRKSGKEVCQEREEDTGARWAHGGLNSWRTSAGEQMQSNKRSVHGLVQGVA